MKKIKNCFTMNLCIMLFASIFSFAEPPEILSAHNVRQSMLTNTYVKHKGAINWWIKYLNGKIQTESRKGGASLFVEITNVHWEVGNYLVEIYEANGYNVELIPGWEKAKNIPDGKTYLSLSW